MIVIEKKYTVNEFVQMKDLDENYFYELINGIILKRTSPNPKHQLILARIYEQIASFVKSDKLGIVLFAPVDVFLDDYNVLIPDLIFVSNDKNK